MPVSPLEQLKRSKPKVEALKRLLAGGDSAEEADRAWTLAELEQRVQGSQAEILKLLKLMNALEVVPGQWRAVEEAKVNPTLDRLLTEVRVLFFCVEASVVVNRSRPGGHTRGAEPELLLPTTHNTTHHTTHTTIH